MADDGRMDPALEIRLADPGRDAGAVARIYAPSVLTSLATFEEVAPAAPEMAARMRTVQARTPWLVAVDRADDRVIGYAYASPHHQRAGYRWAVNVSVYVDPGAQGRGVGRALYDRLFGILRRQRFVNAYAGVALPNPASEALHTAVGMGRIGVYRAVGYKHGRWVDVAWYGVRLRDPDDPPAEPIPIGELDESENRLAGEDDAR
jgi:phosphinothricin acetyltransferase